MVSVGSSMDGNAAIHMKRTILSIDPGIVQIGIAIGVFSVQSSSFWQEMPIEQITEVDLMNRHVHWRFCKTLNLIELVNQCDQSRCSLHHTNEMVDRVNHLVQYFPVFHTVDLILIERQQPGACTDVQNLLMNCLARNKIVLISPASRNKYLGATKAVVFGTKEERRWQRKVMTVQRVLKWMSPWTFLSKNDQVNDGDESIVHELRFLDFVHAHHDAADAAFFIAMYCKQTLWPQWMEQVQQQKKETSNMHFMEEEYSDDSFEEEAEAIITAETSLDDYFNNYEHKAKS